MNARCLVLAMLAAVAAGCGGDGRVVLLQRQVDGLRQDNDQLSRRVTELGAQLDQARQQIDALQSLGGPERLERLFHVQRVHLDRYCTGYDTDGQPGDEGVRVYLTPRDQRGDILKAAGTVTIELYDLAAAEEPRLFAQTYPAEEIDQQWISGVIAYHYRFDCPLPRRPAGREITIRAAFVDYLTGETFTDQSVIEIELPPAGE